PLAAREPQQALHDSKVLQNSPPRLGPESDLESFLRTRAKPFRRTRLNRPHARWQVSLHAVRSREITSYANGTGGQMSIGTQANRRAEGSGAFVVETSRLRKRFGDRVAVDDVDLRVPRGSAFGYLGPNGAGKTTLIRMLLGLTRATAGTMRLLGRPVPAERAAALARVGAIVEEPRFHHYLSGRQNLVVIAAAREREAHGRIAGALGRVGLAERADERVSTYSLGMRQRLGVARALLADPELLILDEPTNGLDPAGMHEFRGMLRTLVAEGRTRALSP